MELEIIISSVLENLGTIHNAIIISIAVMFLDFLTGIYGSYKLWVESAEIKEERNKEFEVTSRKMRLGLLSKGAWVLALFVAFVIGYMTNTEYVLIVTVMALITVELTSIYENIKKMGVSIKEVE